MARRPAPVHRLFEETIVDGLTVLAILPTLTARQHNAVGALAAVHDYHGAARVLGIQPQTFRALLGRARRQFFGLWHEGEVPSRPWGTDRRVARHANGAPLRPHAGDPCVDHNGATIRRLWGMINTMQQSQIQPSVGRVVHYVSRGSADGVFQPACRAAIITEVGADDRVGLAAINPTGMFFHSLADGGCAHHAGDPGVDHSGATMDLSYDGGTWHWPERV